MGGDRSHQDLVATGIGTRDVIGAEVAASARDVLDDHLLAEILGHLLRDDACQTVEDGLGIGIGLLLMLEIDAANGTLMTPLPNIRVPRTGYVAVTPKQASAGNFASGFVDLLVAEAR